MAEPQFQEKTEKATPKRRQEAKKKGQVARSQEIVSVAVLGASLLMLYLYGGWLVDKLGALLSASLMRIAELGRQDNDITSWLYRSTWHYLWLILPMMIALALAALLVNLLQVGFVWSAEPVTPKLSKIDPLQGARRLISQRSLVELGKSMAKIAVVGLVVYWTLKGEFRQLLPLAEMNTAQISRYLGSATLKIMQRGFWAMLVLAILDYAYQRWEFERNLKMTKQEVKEELKQSEGDPHVKGRIRSLQRTMARRRMMAEVPKADVVITNPEHLAVALRYEAATMNAPTVVAKGAALIAERIKELAREHQVAIVEDKPLAQNLYRTVDIGQEIPVALFQAVAMVLAHVYRLKGKVS
ncbi:MAG: flagellar biosynthesis protein FlhB [Deltaproteobacteria bacterium]|nr:flagellar biosynthesis protein FlhB [Deltaproteobacteria bacterium]MBW2069715.1 flagellar biosynthesis protein FlhB [Deltaproteobacteria bacterium]